MSLNNPLSTSSQTSPSQYLMTSPIGASVLTAPGKVFLLGEYAILAGRPALLSAIGPRFALTAEPSLPEWKSWEEEAISADIAEADFHPQSPLARLVDWSESLGAHKLKFRFEDPHIGAGGFGASTAQFALAYRAMADREGWDSDWERVWRLYRELTSDSSGEGLYPPSGADLVTQWMGGTVVFRPDTNSRPAGVEEIGVDFPGAALLVFSASQLEGRKTATHSHLEGLRQSLESMVSELDEPLQIGLLAASAGDSAVLGAAFTAYAEVLSANGLEVAAAREDRLALSALPGVAGAKGSGAMLSDAVTVAMVPGASTKDRARVITEAQSRGLRLLADGITFEPGVSYPN